MPRLDRLQQELSTDFALSSTFRDVSPFLSFLQEAVTSLLSSHLLPVPHHHLMASALDLEGNIKQKELYFLH